uniref:NADH-ubiquinone oxidoreductase chain 6 n=1 Tax=Gymnascella citrina TaxID=37245 RepID=A0AA50Q9I2_9EURO|nr:NADH dehydrogenase subunit 6 [Gymnascella citrina]WMB97489.1 NADH dehydrogenase subunit 6 [Gymnascella citrina]
MFSLYYINDVITNGYRESWLDLFAFICILFGVLTITSKNPIVSVLFLIGLFSVISVYLIMVNLTFIGISYLLVYVGAVSILFLFILMLINIRISELLSKSNNYLPLAILCVIAFVYILGQNIPFNKEVEFNNILTEKINKNELSQNFSDKSEEIYLVVGNNWDTTLVDVTDISSIGNIMYTSYSIWLIITSLILLLSMVGSIVVTLKVSNPK